MSTQTVLGSTVRLQLDVPRLVRRDVEGAKAHLLVGVNVLSALLWPGSPRFERSFYPFPVACHSAGVENRRLGPGENHLRWATTDDETCLRCLAAWRRWGLSGRGGGRT